MIAFAMASGCQMYHGEITAGFSVGSSIFAQDRRSPMYCFQDERSAHTSRMSSLPLSSLHATSSSSSSDMDSLREPNEEESPRFGRQAYWNEFYSNDSTNTPATDSGSSSSSSSNNDGGGFSWYAGWSDLEPFFAELVSMDSRVLIPGIGNDASMVDMYDSGYTNMVAFDYAEQGVECAKRLFGPNRNVDLAVADARSLPYYETCSFDAVLEKGTLDAVYLSGGTDKERAAHYLSMAVSELARLVRPGGIVFSVTAACAPAIDHCFQQQPPGTWKQIRDGSVYITEDGFASINVDGTMFAW
eukprot:CAMPEP_0198296610 /NCGR_PEP_ID=MMETSP1449-20131203/33252_1 /TAXON_ID=420275 /ORGANISM="Attheya septentrionalis, Strain CCMP2084" /LENGTH=300 /DNA_ID=CAMNT_0043997275 /DNA_START=37 /DNA_END=936 /DNA_ORIENTATION=+